MSQTQTQSVTPAAPTTTPAITTAPVVQQPYGNQAALDDAGLAASYSTEFLNQTDEYLAYITLLGWACIDFPMVLVTCLADPKRPSAQRWLSHYTLDDIASEAPELVDTVRELLWPVGRRIDVGGQATLKLEAGCELTGALANERTEAGFDVEMEGELLVGLDVELPAELKALNKALDIMKPLPQLGTDVAVGIGAGVGAGASAGWKVTAGWALSPAAMDGVLGGVPCLPSLDALVRSLDMLIEELSLPETWTVDQVIQGEAEARASIGAGAEAGVEAGLAFGYGLDGDHYYSHATIGAGVTVGFDWGLMQNLLEDPALRDRAAEFGGDIGVRLEIPKDTVTDPRTARFFFCWSTQAGEAKSSTWVEAGTLPSAIEMLWNLLTGDNGGGVLVWDEVPDRVMVRSVERPIEDEGQIAMLTDMVDSPAEASGPDVRTTLTAKGSLRVGKAAIQAAMGGALTFDTVGESDEDAVLDAERQIAARFFGERYEWAGAWQFGKLEDGLAACEVSQSRVEVTTEVTSTISYEDTLEVDHQEQKVGLSAEKSIAYTSVLEVPAEQLRNFLAA